MDDAIVLYPCAGRSHLTAMVELGKLILQHYLRFSVTVLILKAQNAGTASNPDYVTSATAQYIAAVKATTPSINFHELPPISDIPSNTPHAEFLFLLPSLNNPGLHQALQTISQTSKLKALIIDFFCDAAFQVAANLSIPTYHKYTSSTSTLALFLYRPTLHKCYDKIKEDIGDSLLDIPGLPSILASDLPENMSDRSSKLYGYFLTAATNMAKSNGLIVNSFEQLETKAIKAISAGLCVPDGPTPPIFCIGPLLSGSNQGGDGQHECLTWLNSQPRQSVVFLSFGSMGLFSAEQLKEMAVGIENSGQRFLWVVRNPPPDNKKEPRLDELLPEGFLEWTKDRGFVLKQWAPQVEVLSHASVGGFVTHCGWSSTLEAVSAGVPMVGWPLFAEQRMNRVAMVKELKVALAVKDSEDGWVSGEELGKRVRELMEGEEGKTVRERVAAMRDAAVEAWREGGSCRIALAKLLQPRLSSTE
ncbi:anthocyanidin 5,3-O-glucosyltransferase-like [Carya illinoinensis]|uniref:Glycosyltransferase n=1 Tax=Carya illinoinensis TaxID=32201 RepID=A0A8T1PZX1_CARIL|nr:anthocyanidin 5,3-O-glucosyltransferase-like [Carya illinoinensis]KAG6649886.1 hypothetical protein CIPAW_06G004600 [Carya illinoinensis]